MTTEILARDAAPVPVVDDGEPSPVLRTPVRRLYYWDGEVGYISDSVRLLIPVLTCFIS